MRQAFILSTPQHDPYFQNHDYQSWFRFHCPLVAGYTPSFDKVPIWHPRALAYFDAYAIFDSTLVPTPNGASGVFSFYSGLDNPWILRSAAGENLKIDWREADGSYHQYAGDVSNPDFVAHAIGLMRGILAQGYAGVYLDDVNLAPRFVTEAGVAAVPLGYDQSLWQRAMLQYMREVRAAFPDKTIVHNTPWWDVVDEQLALADYLNIERGFGDPNLKPADFIKMAQVVERAHAIGCKVIMEEYTKASLPISLPCYDAVCRDGDLLAVEDMMPPDWAV